MTPLLQNAKCVTDLDFNFFKAINLAGIEPVPEDIVASDDPRLSDPRMPLPGSVTNDSVALDANISQSKLNLNGQIPSAWLGSTSSTAARGDLAEYIANKGQPNGYAPVGSDGKIPVAFVPPGVGTGTVTSVALTVPAQFTLSGSPITGSGTLALDWVGVPVGSWFGRPSGGGAGPPSFQITPLPVSLIPNLDMSKITTGNLPQAQGGVPTGGAANQIIRKNSATDFDAVWDSLATAVKASPLNPPGVATTTGKMLGYGTATYGPFLFTPSFGGKALIMMEFGVSNNVANAVLQVGIRYGQGTPPNNQDGATGTPGAVFTRAGVWDAGAASQVSLSWLILDLQVGAQYWFDLSAFSTTGASITTVTGCTFLATELP